MEQLLRCGGQHFYVLGYLDSGHRPWKLQRLCGHDRWEQQSTCLEGYFLPQRRIWVQWRVQTNPGSISKTKKVKPKKLKRKRRQILSNRSTYLSRLCVSAKAMTVPGEIDKCFSKADLDAFRVIVFRKHRKNCECCPGHYLIINHYSSI